MATLLRNLTPHAVHVVNDDGAVLITVPPDPAGPARCSTTRQSAGTLDLAGPGGDPVQVPVTATTFGAVQGLPPAAPGVTLVVSRIILGACPDRADLVVPDDVVRDDAGAIVGCRSFARS